MPSKPNQELHHDGYKLFRLEHYKHLKGSEDELNLYNTICKNLVNSLPLWKRYFRRYSNDVDSAAREINLLNTHKRLREEIEQNHLSPKLDSRLRLNLNNGSILLIVIGEHWLYFSVDNGPLPLSKAEKRLLYFIRMAVGYISNESCNYSEFEHYDKNTDCICMIPHYSDDHNLEKLSLGKFYHHIKTKSAGQILLRLNDGIHYEGQVKPLSQSQFNDRIATNITLWADEFFSFLTARLKVEIQSFHRHATNIEAEDIIRREEPRSTFRSQKDLYMRLTDKKKLDVTDYLVKKFFRSVKQDETIANKIKYHEGKLSFSIPNSIMKQLKNIAKSY